MNVKELDSLIVYISSYLGGERNMAQKRVAVDFIRKELSLRPSIDEKKLKDRLELSQLSIRDRYSFFEKKIIPEIRNGYYDVTVEKMQSPKKQCLSSINLFKAMDEIGVKDDVDRILIDYYINAVWEQSDITIEEVRHFTDKAIEWMKSLPPEKRKTSILLELCKRSSTLSKYLSREKAMEKVQEWVKENERLDDELDAFYDSICGGESDD